MDTIEKVFEVIKSSSEPINAGKITEQLGIDRKEVDEARKKLKDEGQKKTTEG